MLSQLLADHAALHCALGFKFRTPGILLRNFVNFAELRGEHIITTGSVREWALQAPSPEQRRNRLLTVRRFALALHAEDPRHEVPAADLFGRASHKRRTPYIYSPGDIRRLIDAAHHLGPNGSIRPVTYATLFGLIAATGMRVSEALAIRLSGRDRRWADHCHDQVQEEPVAAASCDDPARLGRIPRELA
jgi:integrase